MNIFSKKKSKKHDSNSIEKLITAKDITQSPTLFKLLGTKQPEYLCIAIVKTSPYNLRMVYPFNQTERVCLEAVKRDGSILKYVSNPTMKVCKAAVKNYPYALKYVNADKQTYKMCLKLLRKKDMY